MIRLPFSHSRQNTTTIIPRTKFISAGSFLTKISNLSTHHGKSRPCRKGRARLCRLLAQCTILLARTLLHIIAFASKQMPRRMHAFLTDAVKNARLLRRSRLPRPQNTRQHFGHSVYSFFMDFLIFLFYPPCLFILLLLCTTCSWKHIPPELSYKHIRFGFEIEHAHKIHQSSIHHCVAHERL